MISDRIFLLNNSDFLKTQAGFYNELLASQDMSDVTLACDDYEIGAHKTILSASSLFFREVIRKSKHASPYIYLKGINKETLDSLLKLMYVGESTTSSENIDELIDVGNELQIFGIIKKPQSITTKKSKSKEKRNFNVANYVRIEPCEQENDRTAERSVEDFESSEVDVADYVKIELSEQEKEKMDNTEESVEDLESSEFDEEKKEIVDSNINESIEEEIQKRITAKRDKNGRKYHVCNICLTEKKFVAKMKLHVETHLDGFSHNCKLCPFVAKTRRNFQIHLVVKHSKA